MKISKAAWMIVGAGAFVIILAGLGMAWSGQMQEQSSINEELLTLDTRLANINASQFQGQIDELEQKLQASLNKAEKAEQDLIQTVISVDVADKFYEIARRYGVTVNNIGTSQISKQPYLNIGCEVISLRASVRGDLSHIIDFVIGLNKDFTTGYVQAVQLSIGREADDDSSASLQMIVYSYLGSE